MIQPRRLKLSLRSAAAAAVIAIAAIPRAEALTIGEYRQAYATAHALDEMTSPQRTAYIATHKNELDLAQARLDAAKLVVDTILRMNGLEMQAARPPLVCNYIDENDEIDVKEWVDEFRAKALTRFHLAPGPQTDRILDAVDIDDVIGHMIMEKYPCPSLGAQPVAATAANRSRGSQKP